jgi:hypothetical protein
MEESMRKQRNLLLGCIALILVISSLVCNMPTEETGEEADYVSTLAAMQLTQKAMADVPVEPPAATATFTQAPAPPTETPPQTGSISGRLTYPSEYIPAQRVVAFQVGSEFYYYVQTAENQSTYQIADLPPGTYHIVAYLIDGDLSAGYTQAVPCGLSVDCTDHSLIGVPVTPGQDSGGIDPADWYAPEGAFPPDPIQ